MGGFQVWQLCGFSQASRLTLVIKFQMTLAEMKENRCIIRVNILHWDWILLEVVSNMTYVSLKNLTFWKRKITGLYSYLKIINYRPHRYVDVTTTYWLHCYKFNSEWKKLLVITKHVVMLLYSFNIFVNDFWFPLLNTSWRNGVPENCKWLGIEKIKWELYHLSERKWYFSGPGG